MHHDVHAILETLVFAIVLGITAQQLAHRLKLPAILPLLVFGMAAGPHGLGLFNPEDLGFGHLEVLIHLGVAIILFEGGLSLELGQLKTVSKTLRNLLTIGTVVTGLGAAALAHYVLALGWPAAALFGAVVTVTGPTVIVPLLRHMIAPRKVRTTLMSEGLMIDPIGAVLAYMVLQLIINKDLGPRELLVQLLTLSFAGALLGFAGGALARVLVGTRRTPEELRGLVVLAIVSGTYLLAEASAEQSGVLAAVVMGLTMAAWKVADLLAVKEFKGQLTILIISVLFILLSAKLDLRSMLELGIPGLAVVAGLIFIVRPLSVLLSVPPSELDGRQRVVLALTAPRGIVAAAVASLSAIQLRDVAGAADDAAILEGLVYLTILITCTWATIMSPILPRALGYLNDPSRRRVILVGAHPVSVAIARMLGEEQWSATIVDASRAKLDEARGKGVLTCFGDARVTTTYEDAGTERDSFVLALTTNDELNVLIANLVRNEFGVEHPVIAFQSPHEEFGSMRGAWVDMLSGGPVSMQRWSRLLEDHKAEMLTVTLPKGESLSNVRSILRGQGADYLLICGWNGRQPRFKLSLAQLDEVQRISVITLRGEARARLEAALTDPSDDGEAPDDDANGEQPDASSAAEAAPADQAATQRMPIVRREAGTEPKHD